MKTVKQQIAERFFGVVNDPKKAPQSTEALVVEIAPQDRPELPSPEVRQAIIALPHNIGFQYLVRKFLFQKAVLNARLRSTKHQSLEDVQILQAGISAADWFKTEVEFETKQQAPEKKQPSSYERQLFEEINSNFNVLQ